MTDSSHDRNKSREAAETPGIRGLATLASELASMAQRDPEALERRIGSLNLREQAELVLRLPAEKRLEMLLHSPRPMRLVRALPDAELYLTVREVGPVDALPLLGLASAQQMEHLVDLEAWRGDRFDAKRMGAWAALFVEAGESSLRRFLKNTDVELLALLFNKWMHIEQLEYEDGADKHGHGLGDAGTEEGYLTPDGYHRFKPVIDEHAPAIRRILKMMFEEQSDRYQEIIWSSMWDLPSNLEEQALHWRQSRLEEHGFPTFEEALSVFVPVKQRETRATAPGPDNPDALPSGRSPLRVGSARGTLTLAIDLLPDPARERVLAELISIANRLLVAECADTGDLDAHRSSLRKATIFVEIGLELSGACEPGAMAGRLDDKPVFDWFSAGYAEPAALQRQARRLVRHGWASRHAEALELLDSPIRERILALLERRPLYFSIEIDDGTGKGGQRDFHTLAELEESRVALEVGELFGRLMVESLGLDIVSFLENRDETSSLPSRFSTFLLTALAWTATRDELRGDPLPPDATADFLRTVASRRTAAPDAPARAFADLAERLRVCAGLDARETAVLEAFGRYCLQQLSEECSNLDPGIPLDPRMISCLILERTKPEGVSKCRKN